MAASIPPNLQEITAVYTQMGRNIGTFCAAVYQGAIEAGMDPKIVTQVTAEAARRMIEGIFFSVTKKAETSTEELLSGLLQKSGLDKTTH